MASIDEIAKQANVSRSTVAAVLSGSANPTRKSAKRRAEHIRGIAEKMGYRPNTAAKAVSTGRFGCATLLITRSPHRSHFHPQLIGGLHDGLDQNGMHLTFAKLTDQEIADEASVPKVLREQMSDGLLINYTDHIPPALTAMIRSQGIPAVWINSAQDHDCVHPDDFQAGQLAAERLIESGCRKPAYADFTRGPEDRNEAHYSEWERQHGFVQTIRKAGIEPRIIRDSCQLPIEQRYEAVCAVLDGPDRPDGVATPSLESIFVPAALSRGLDVPRDLRIVAIGEARAWVAGRFLDSVCYSPSDLGIAAGKMMHSKAEEPSKVLDCRTIPYRLILDSEPEHSD